MSYLRDKTIWLTGASSGIGLALARELAKHDVQLILTSRRKEALEEVRQSLPNSDKHRVLALDLSQPEAAAAAAKKRWPTPALIF